MKHYHRPGTEELAQVRSKKGRAKLTSDGSINLDIYFFVF